jgi:hypothetical protein
LTLQENLLILRLFIALFLALFTFRRLVMIIQLVADLIMTIVDKAYSLQKAPFVKGLYCS